MRHPIEESGFIPEGTPEEERSRQVEATRAAVRRRARNLIARDPRWKVLRDPEIIPGAEPGSYTVRMVLDTEAGRMGQPWD